MRLEIGLLHEADRGSVRLACIQFEPLVGELETNLIAIERLVREAAGKGAAVVVLPELADSGYMFRNAAELAQLAGAIPDGRSAALLCALARALNLVIISGLAERDGDMFYNAAMICGPEGYLGKYRKLHLWDQENRFFHPGDLGLPVFDTPVGKIGIAICYDGWFPETFRQLTLREATLVCVPTNWVPMPGNDWHSEPMANVLHKAAAHSNGLYIACADRIGTERGQPFLGCSLIVGPAGWPVAGPASGEHEEILFADLDLASVADGRRLNSFNDLIGDRRTDVYG